MEMYAFACRSEPEKLVAVEEAPVPTVQVLASCQALVVLDDGDLVGDPMEKATLKAIQWNPTKGLLYCCFSLLECP